MCVVAVVGGVGAAFGGAVCVWVGERVGGWDTGWLSAAFGIAQQGCVLLWGGRVRGGILE